MSGHPHDEDRELAEALAAERLLAVTLNDYIGKWVAVKDHLVVESADTLAELRAFASLDEVEAIFLVSEPLPFFGASLAHEEAERAGADEERQLRNTAIAEWYADAAQMENKLARCEATLEAIREGVRNPTMDYETVRISPSGLAALSAREPGKEPDEGPGIDPRDLDPDDIGDGLGP